MENLRNGPQSERLKRIDGFWSEGSYYLPEDFMTKEQGDAYLERLAQTIDGMNHQWAELFGTLRGGTKCQDMMSSSKQYNRR